MAGERAARRKLLARPAFVLVIGLCTASLACEVMRLQADATLLRSLQARWDCLAHETAQVPRCVALARLGPHDDADFCDEAVLRCRALGTYAQADEAVARYFMWLRVAIAMRISLFAGLVGSLAWMAIVKPIRRRLGTR